MLVRLSGKGKMYQIEKWTKNREEKNIKKNRHRNRDEIQNEKKNYIKHEEDERKKIKKNIWK